MLDGTSLIAAVGDSVGQASVDVAVGDHVGQDDCKAKLGLLDLLAEGLLVVVG